MLGVPVAAEMIVPAVSLIAIPFSLLLSVILFVAIRAFFTRDRSDS